MAAVDSPVAIASFPNAKLFVPILLLPTPIATEAVPFACAPFPKDKLFVPKLIL